MMAQTDVLGLDGAAAIVLGVGPGMGLETVRVLASAGARVTCVDLQEDIAESAKELAAELGSEGMALTGDATDRSFVDSVVEQSVSRWGRLDSSVSIIGRNQLATLEESTDENWTSNWDINLRPPLLLTQASAKAMKKQGSGSIVVITSINGTLSSPRAAAYGAAKAGLVSMMRTAAVEFGRSGVRVNAISPGVVLTPRISFLAGSEEGAQFEARIPMGRLGSPHEIANTALFLASPMSSYVTGQVIGVDGGASVAYQLPTPEWKQH
ncbi:SDR family NAD(P)-dependent oxidoreductase [Aeromicrobium wangtongii]|uniref:SDR family oxidoreductase n=1 Tax=Aeromicrobium wangtongii TaxID=2969247 RepID=A0ABY5M8L6_9ACTN|nr:SDR family oxidoreductase [Aeromicrobium wangtongii]MCD9196978.1 SDR family oxidoreductase [Aeromicrobium wangtongii]UUP14480.1 SDR family oxidoreductase [Aeromicrobium wangtongii]